MDTGSITIPMDDDLKAQALDAFDSLSVDMGKAIVEYLRLVVKKKKLPSTNEIDEMLEQLKKCA